LTADNSTSTGQDPQPIDLLLRQARAAERIADHLTPEAEERRVARLSRAFSWLGTRLVLLAGLLLGGGEMLQWVYQAWETRSAAQDYAEVGSEIFYKENNPEVAQSLVSEAIALNPDNSEYRFLEAYIDGMARVRTLLNLDRPYTKEELNQTHEALAKALFLERQAPDKPESQLLRGQIYAALADYQRARESILSAIGKAEESQHREVGRLRRAVHSSLVYALELIGIDKSRETIGGLLNMPADAQLHDGNLAFAYVRLALVEHKLGAVQSAFEYLDRAIEYDPTSKWAYLWLGIFEAGANQWDIARAHYDKAILLDSRFDLAYYNKGWTYLRSKKKDYSAARAMFQKALLINPNYKEAYYGLGMVYGYQNKYEVSKGYLTKALDIDEKFLTGWKWRAIVHDELGNLDNALQDFSSAISLDPSNDDLYVRRARVFSKKAQYERALQDLLLAKDFNAQNYRIPFYTGKVFSDLEQYENAVVEYSKALKLRGGYGEALVGRAQAYQGLGDVVRAREDYDEAVDKVTYRPERMLQKRGNFFFLQGEYQLAVNDFRRARETNSRFAPAWLAEAKAAIKLDDRETALFSVNEYLKLKPQSKDATAIKQELLEQ